MIRESKGKTAKFAISLWYNTHFFHYRIHTDSISGLYYISTKSKFETLVELVKHHSKNPDGLVTTLQYPAPNPKKPPMFSVSFGLDEWEFKRAYLQIGQKKGEGKYGEVYEAVIKDRNIPVIIKTFRVSVCVCVSVLS